MSERLSDKDLDLIGLRFPTHFGVPETSVLVQRVLSELRERRAQDMTSEDFDILGDLLGRINANNDGELNPRQSEHLAVIRKLLGTSDGAT